MSPDLTAAVPPTKTPGWLDWHPAPGRPRFRLPPGAVDAHCHVFGPADRYPYAPQRKYTPCDASHEQLIALRDRLGIARNVIVQATCHGTDNRAMADACRAGGGRARGVATVRRNVADTELRSLHEAGVRGVRFNFLRRLVDTASHDERVEIAARIAPLGWHVPDRVLWGTDWPHPNLTEHMPDDGRLVDFIPHIATTADLQQRLLVRNPMRLYWPDEAIAA